VKRLLPIAAFVAVVAAGAYIVAPTVLSGDRVKSAVTQELSARAGRPVTFDGEPTITLFPNLGFRIQKVVVANAPGLGDDPFAVVESVRGRIKILPLFFGRIEPGSIVLVAPRIQLKVDAGGRANWDVGGPVVGAPLDRQVASALRRSAGRAFGRVHVVDGYVTYDNAQTGATSALSAINLTLTWRQTNDSAFATGTMVWRGETVEISGSLAKPVDFFGGKVSPASLNLRATPLRLSFQGNAYAASSVGFDGEISVAAPSVRRALTWLGRNVGEGSTLGAASIRAKAKLTGTAITLADAAMELDGNEAAGGLRIALGDRVAVQGTLAFSSLDVSPYIESIRASFAGSSDWEPVAIDLPLLRDTDFDVRVSAKQVVVGNAKLGAAAASAVGTGGRVSIDIGELQIYGGTLQAAVTADLNGPAMHASMRATVTNVPTREALGALTGIDAISGTASATVEVRGRANTWNALLQTATGSASVRLADCTIGGFDIGAIAGDGPDDTLANRPQATTFDSIVATMALEGGSVTTNNLVADGADYAVTLEGSASLLQPTIKARGTLALRGTPTRPDVGDSDDGDYEIPFVIGGSWMQPLISPDIDRILLRKEASRPRPQMRERPVGFAFP
jgi:AsmA protein